MKRLLISFLFVMIFTLPAFGAVSDYAGIYSGTFSGSNSGKWIAVVESDGHTEMLLYSTVYNNMDGCQGYYVTEAGTFSGVTLINETVITVVFTLGGSITGTWATPPSYSGTLTGTKQTSTAQYAGTYTGTFTGTDTGTWTMTVDSTGTISGNGNSNGYGPYDIEGAVDNSGMIMVATDDTGSYGSIVGSAMSGTWYDELVIYGGTFTGTKQAATKTWYADTDGDGYGDPSNTATSATQPPGYVEDNTDCDDSNASIHPGAIELCNGVDDNCNGITDEGCGSAINYYIPVFKPPTGYWSGLGVTNLGASGNATVTVTIYSQAGVVLATEVKIIAAKGQDAFLVGAALATSGWIKVSSTHELAGLNFLGQYDGATTNYYLADVPFVQDLSTTLTIPHVAQNTSWDTSIYPANPNSSTANVTFTYTNKEGTASTPYTTTIPANGSKEISVALIAGSTNVRGGSVAISSTQGLTAFAIYNNLKTGNFSYAGINAVDTSSPDTPYIYYLPVYKPPTAFWSGLGVTNLSTTSSANVTVTVYNQSGIVQTTELKTIVAKGQDAFIVGAALSSTGWIKVTSTQALAGLNFLGQYEGATTNYYLADVPFTQVLSKSLLIPHVAQNTTWDTAVYIANPNSTLTVVTFTYISKSGVPSTPYVTTIPGNGSKEVTVATIAGSTDIRGGSVTIVSVKNLTAFAIYNNLKTGNFSYAGINAKDIAP